MPLRALFFAGLITLGAAALAAWLHAPTSTRADIIPGEYSMEVDVAPAQVALGDTFVAQVGLSHEEIDGFSGVQWHVNYSEAFASVVSMQRSPGSPPDCTAKHNSGTRVLVGCSTFIPNGLSFSGLAWDITFTCNLPGIVELTVELANVPSPSQVIKFDGSNPPAHAHNDSVECSASAPTKTPGPITPTSTPITGPRGGDWGLRVRAPVEAELGANFNATLSADPQPGGYRAAQWYLGHDPVALDAGPFQRTAIAPLECILHVSVGNPQIFICGTDATNGLLFAGDAFTATFTCLSVGPTEIYLDETGDGDPYDSLFITGEYGNSFTEETSVNSVTVDCVEPLPFIGLVKAIDGELPEEGEGTQLHNLWLCYDQSTDGIDNDGDSTVDNESATCDANGEGYLDVEELVFAPRDCDTRNDDDDGDGRPVDGSVADGSSTAYVGSNPRPECRQPTLEDFIQDEVDKDGGEVPEGLGAIEFQIKFDHKIFDIMVTESDDESDGIDNDADTMVDEPDEDWANGRFENCSMTLISENDIRFGCITSDATLGHFRPNGISVADISVLPEPDLRLRIRPGKDNGVVRRILQENCEVADIFGDIFPHTNAGLTPACTDLDITVRRLEGDLDTDCDVTIIDAQRVAFRYGSFFGQLLYDPNFDLEPFVAPDFDVDIKDLQFVFGRVGSTCAAPVPNNQDPIAANGVGQP